MSLGSGTVALEWLAAIAAAAGIALFVGRTWGRLGLSQLEKAAAAEAQRAEQLETENRAQQREISRVAREKGNMTQLALCLPDVIHEMNRGDLEPREVPPLILKLAHAVFQPRQVLLYGLRSSTGPEGRRRELVLVEQRGLGKKVPEQLKIIPVGAGRIGWCAQHELEMLAEDWANLMRRERRQVDKDHSSLDSEIMGPLVHREGKGNQVLGVLSLGGIGIRPADPKLMFKMVINLGSLALVSAMNLGRLRQMANHDGLTGLLNKSSLLENFGPNALMGCEKNGQPLALLIFDVDNFKHYNDTNGHPAGDVLLQTLAELIRETIRPGDLACRYGGEEFIVAMPDTEPREALELANRLREAVASATFEHREKQPKGYVSVSGGVAVYPKDGGSIRELILHADETLYHCKKGGRDRVALYEGVSIGAV